MEGTTLEESKQILIAITELKTNVSNLSEKMTEITKISNMVIQTDQSTKSAHNRIDEVKVGFEKTIKDEKEERQKSFRELKEDFAKEMAKQDKDFDDRFDKVEKVFNDKIAAECKAREKVEDSLMWVWRTVTGGGITLILGVVLFYLTRG